DRLARRQRGVVRDRGRQRGFLEQARQHRLGAGRGVGPHGALLVIERLFHFAESSDSVQPRRATSVVTTPSGVRSGSDRRVALRDLTRGITGSYARRAMPSPEPPRKPDLSAIPSFLREGDRVARGVARTPTPPAATTPTGRQALPRPATPSEPAVE